MLGNIDAFCELQAAMRDALMESAFRELVEITFEDGFVICHKKGGERVDFDNAVGELGKMWLPIVNKYGLQLVGRNGCAMHFDDYTLRFKLANKEAVPVKLHPNMNIGKRLLLMAAASLLLLGVQASYVPASYYAPASTKLIVTNGMESLVVPDSIKPKFGSWMTRIDV